MHSCSCGALRLCPEENVSPLATKKKIIYHVLKKQLLKEEWSLNGGENLGFPTKMREAH